MTIDTKYLRAKIRQIGVSMRKIEAKVWEKRAKITKRNKVMT